MPKYLHVIIGDNFDSLSEWLPALLSRNFIISLCKRHLLIRPISFYHCWFCASVCFNKIYVLWNAGICPIARTLKYVAHQMQPNHKVFYKNYSSSSSSNDNEFRPTVYANDTIRYRHSYYGRRIGTRMRSIKWCYFQWPWTKPNPVFKVTPLFDAKYLTNGYRKVQIRP